MEVDLAANDAELIGSVLSGIERADGGAARRVGEERHEQLLRVALAPRERVRLHHSPQLCLCPDDDGRRNSQLTCKRAFDVVHDRRRGFASREDDVAAHEMRLHALVAEAGEEVAQVGHRDAVPTPEVHPAQKRHVRLSPRPRHAAIVGPSATGCSRSRAAATERARR